MGAFDWILAKGDTKQGFHKYTQPLLCLTLLGLILVVALVIQELVANEAPVKFYLRLTLLMVAACSFALGLIVAFVMAPYGDEKQTFGPMAGLINGVIGGFAVSDLSKGNSAIIRGFHSLAAAAGVSGIGLIGSIVAFFGVMGFLCGYINKQYVLNPSLSQTKLVEDQRAQITEISKNINVSLVDLESAPTISESDRKALKDVLEPFTKAMENDGLLKQLCLDTIKAYAKGFLLLQDWEKCEAVLRKARSLAPDDPELLFQLAKLYCKSGRPETAMAPLSTLKELPSASVSTYKLLGYALLFIPSRLDEAEAASKLYLEAHPEDPGAKINLACVYGQRGPQELVNRQQAISLLGQAIRESKEAKPAIDKLRIEGQDFAAWGKVPEFVALFESNPDGSTTNSTGSQPPHGAGG